MNIIGQRLPERVVCALWWFLDVTIGPVVRRVAADAHAAVAPPPTSSQPTPTETESFDPASIGPRDIVRMIGPGAPRPDDPPGTRRIRYIIHHRPTIEASKALAAHDVGRV